MCLWLILKASFLIFVGKAYKIKYHIGLVLFEVEKYGTHWNSKVLMG